MIGVIFRDGPFLHKKRYEKEKGNFNESHDAIYRFDEITQYFIVEFRVYSSTP